MKYGKKLYKTSMLNSFRLFLFAVVLFFFHDFYLETYSEQKFIERADFTLMGVMKFYYAYPHEVIVLCLIVFLPAIYYGFFRGVSFFEKGILYNKGIPFLNVFIPYEKIKSYKLLYPDMIVSLKLETGEMYLIADNNLKRVIALIDQHEIPGNFAQDEYLTLIKNFKKYILVITVFTYALIIVRKFGIFKTYF
jgi:hypothetical protein